MADNVEEQYGDYAALVNPTYATTPLQSLVQLATSHSHGPGCKDNRCKNYNNTEVKAAVTGADLVIICLGTGKSKKHIAYLLVC